MTTHTTRPPSDDATGAVTDQAVAAPSPMSPLDEQLRVDFDDVRRVVDASDVPQTFEHLVVTRSAKGNKMGRPRKLSLRAFLILAILTCLRERPPSIVKIVQTANELPDELLEELGLKAGDGPRPRITAHQIGHVFNLIANNLDLSPYTPGKRLRRTVDGELIDEFKPAKIDPKCLTPDLTDEDLTPVGPSRRLVDRSERDLDPEEFARREATLHELLDRLIQATLPEDLNILTTAIDWTDRDSWARGYRNPTTKRDGVASADPDARFGRRRPSGNSFSVSRKGKGTKASGDGFDDQGFETDKIEMYLGYVIHLAVSTKEIDGPDVPELALALRVAPADDMGGVGPSVADMIDSIRTVAPIEHVILDRGYTMRVAPDLHHPLAERDVHLTFDLSENQRRRAGTAQGAVVMGGDFYCPLVPREIEVDGMLGPNATRDDWAAFHTRYDARYAWMMSHKGRPTADLAQQRLVCPALAGKIRCPRRSDSMAISVDKDIPEIYESQLEDTAAAPPPCCTAKSITVRREEGEGQRQRYRFGSKEWIRSYERRTASERLISHYKKLVRTGREDIQMFGRTRVTLGVGFATVALNIRLVRNGQSGAAPALRSPPSGGGPAVLIKACTPRRVLETAPPAPSRHPSMAVQGRDAQIR